MNFQYKGKSALGKTINGKVDADSKRDALFQLEKEDLIIIDINETKTWNKDIIINKRVKNKDFVIFLRQYSTLIHAGISISDATKTMMKQTENRTLENALADIVKQLEQGHALSDAAKRHPKVFPSLLVNMIRAGEASGKLDEILNQMADYFEKEYRNRQRVISALIYPSVVGVITLLLSMFLLVFIVPQFVGMFHSFGEDIPAYTQFVMQVSDWVIAYWWVFFILVGIFLTIYRYLINNNSFVYKMDGMKMKFPIVGTLVHKSAMVRMTQTLSTLVNSSVPILQSVEITEKVVGNRIIQQALTKSRKSLEVGESLAMPMKDHWAFPALIVQMIEIGERTGTLDYMLMKAADFYEEEVEQLSNRIKVLIEPLMIIVLACIVGSVVIAVVIPMFSLFEKI
ncbi:type II secretion system protein F [Virgibacillus phasianinus]|uniref:Type II secretion system protein F n=1 Tax=Virgibacillus phasianinus TaxID=2017483 RepID=A0A220U4H8_9BACI|nr:type II secretion system F family protein [Virgibacillus phasianinus]ASK62965.1 type II secretion system protein F [Virgibacillus phasianinus]